MTMVLDDFGVAECLRGARFMRSGCFFAGERPLLVGYSGQSEPGGSFDHRPRSTINAVFIMQGHPKFGQNIKPEPLTYWLGAIRKIRVIGIEALSQTASDP